MQFLTDSKLFYAMAKEHVSDKNLWDDCVQEAAIHVWRMKERHPGMSAQYYHKCARSRIQEVSKRNTFFGQEARRGTPIDPLRRPHDSWDQMNGWCQD